MEDNNTVDLRDLNNIPSVPSVYYGATSGLVGKIDPFAGRLIAKATLPGGTVIATTVNLIKDPNNPGKVIASTVLASGITYFVASSSIAVAISELVVGTAAVAAGVAVAPVAISIAAAVGLAVVATMAGSQLQEYIYKAFEEFEEFDIYSPEITGTATKTEFILQGDRNVMDAFPDYINYRQITKIIYGDNLADFIKYDKSKKEAEIKVPKDFEEDYIKRMLKNTPVKKVILNDNTYNVASEKNKLLIRNAIDEIVPVSFLLSKILIKSGEVLDIGDQGLYTIKSGDTMSEIAKLKGMTTQELLKLNTWLIDDDCIKFNYPTKEAA